MGGWAVVAGVVAWACGAVSAWAAPEAVTGFRVVDVANRLATPTGIAFAPDGRLFILEKGGRLRVWTERTGLREAPLLTIPTCTQSEMGLLGAAVDPGFATNGYLYLYHTQPPDGDPLRCGTPTGRTNRVVRVTVGDDTATDLTVLLDGIQTDNGNHDGGALRIGPDGHLYVGVGDTGRGDFGNPGDATNPYAQNRRRLEGKILRLTTSGAPAPGNPFADEGGDAPYVFAYGLRNPFRIAFEPGTDLLWVADVGQNTWEEINVVRAGDNLGWPQCEAREPASTCPGDTVPPVYAYNHDGGDASVTGGVFYDATTFGPAYRGNYFFGDYELNRIWRAVPVHDPEGFAATPDVFVQNAGGPVDFAVGPDGNLYYVAIGANAVRRVVPSAGASAGCVRGLGTRTARWAREADRAVARCLASGREACTPPETFAPSMPASLVRTIARSCGPAPSPDLCGRLGCEPCVTVRDLRQCVAARVTAFVVGFWEDLSAPDDPCARAVLRAAIRATTAGLSARQRCRVQRRTGCAQPALPAGLVRKIQRACNDPSAAICAAAECTTCGNGTALADCLAATTAEWVGTFAEALDGPQ